MGANDRMDGRSDRSRRHIAQRTVVALHQLELARPAVASVLDREEAPLSRMSTQIAGGSLQFERHGCHIAGVYITGANEDRLSEGYARVAPGKEFLTTPVYISAGRDDRIATLEQQYNVAGSIKRTGFQRIKIGTFRGGHEANDAQTSIALRWFRQLQ